MTDRETLKAMQVEPGEVQSWIDEVWHLWQSDGGDHYATRGSRLTEEQMRAGYERTVPADTPEELLGLLLKQPDAPKGGIAS